MFKYYILIKEETIMACKGGSKGGKGGKGGRK